MFGHGGVVFVDDFVKRETILEARATATLHKHAQFQIGVAFFGNEVGHFGGCTVCEDNGFGHFCGNCFG